jgi:predicted porin
MVAGLLCLAPAALRAEETKTAPGVNPATTGPEIPSDLKPPAPVKTSDFTVYGRLNVSLDHGTQGFGGVTCNNANSCGAVGNTPQGVTHWMPDVASNLSRFGVRGSHSFAEGWQGVFQIEAEVSAAATPGAKNNGNNDTINPGNNAVSGTLGSRDTFVGVGTPLGAIKLGKGDTPYKRITADFDFLADTPGDYNSIMGNTGGDNRTEFDARFPHAIWYESPNVGGLRVNAMWSPGQNRFTDNIGFGIGETVCAGGNSGPCNDGSFGDGYSVSGQWEGMGLKAIVSYEMHKSTNRTGDAGQTTAFGTSAVGVGDESAIKFGAKYTVAASGTTVAGIFEDIRRRDAMPWNERQRNGFYLSAMQKLGGGNEVMAGWAHAGKSPGDPTSGPVDNQANMFGFGFKHWFYEKATVYLAYAWLANETGAHYALGPGGHGVTWDCKDGNGPGSFVDSTGAPIGLEKNATNCFTGTTIQAFSLGLTYDF